MANKGNNDDIINDILNELDKKNEPAVPDREATGLYRTESVQSPSSDEPVDDFSKTETFSNQKSEKVNAVPQNYQSEVRIRKAPERYPSEDMMKRKSTAPSNGSKNKKKKRKKKRSRLPGVLILTTFIFAVSICLSLVIIAYGKDMLGIGKSEKTQRIVIPDGATTEDIARILENDGIIKSPEFFKLFSRLSNSDSAYIAGEHFVRPNMAYETIIQELTSLESEKKESVEVTFPEGITLYEAAEILEENGVCSVDDFLFNFNAGDLGFAFEDRLSPPSSLRFYRMEGFLFPDTYFFYKDMDPEQVCMKIYVNFDNKMTEERYQKMEQLNLSLDQLITFASIVQREAATMDSMTMVASVFWNRLNNPDIFPQLQSDPTRLYAENVIKPHMDVYDQAIIDAYNTYVGTGLPPGPICNPGIEAIDAVLAAFESEYFYFIANVNTGQTYFSATLEEHEAYQAQIEQDIAAAKESEAQEGDE
ncbi:MAG: endolytic transglycosylase MltG [Ruminococcus sp.]|nr:endolytic transglycosylase MltG [Ruminococcus sp.]